MTTPCPERELLPEYLTERLAPAEAARVHHHLASCAECRRLAAELEIGLAALAIARDEAIEQERVQPAAATGAWAGQEPRTAAGSTGSTGPESAGWRAPRRRRWIGFAAASCALLVGGAAVGAALQRQSETPDAFAEDLPLASVSELDPASGSMDLAAVEGGLQIALDLDGLPADADYFECLWIVNGDTRSAGSFVAVDGAADVDLVVAPFAGADTWVLDIVAHDPDHDPRVVLTASRT